MRNLAGLWVALPLVACGGPYMTDPSASKVDIAVDWTANGRGNYAISGTVRLPVEVKFGTLFGIEARRNDLLVARTAVLAASADRLSYRIDDLSDGEYTIRMQVDKSANQVLGNKDDYDGYYDGAITTPILSLEQARKISVSGADVTGADFGLGVIP